MRCSLGLSLMLMMYGPEEQLHLLHLRLELSLRGVVIHMYAMERAIKRRNEHAT